MSHGDALALSICAAPLLVGMALAAGAALVGRARRKEQEGKR